MWSEKLKLNKQLLKSITEAGFLSPKEIQAMTLSRIAGGQDLVIIAPENAGKTTTYILGVLSKLKYGVEEAPRALILVPDKERVEQVLQQFELLNKNKTIRLVGVFPGPSIDAQMEEVLEGVDIVVATPDRARAIYLKLGLNLNKIQMLVIDDADLIVKQGLQLPVAELANSIRNCQHLVFTEVLHERVEKMIDPFMKQPVMIELDEISESKTEIIPQILYHVPNFRTKLNLIQLLLEDAEVFTKAAVFVNTRLTAEKVFQSLKQSVKRETAILNPIYFESNGTESFDGFLEAEEYRVLIVANEINPEVEVSQLPFIIHLELPQEKETYISRIIKNDLEQETMAITIASDIELSSVKKIEQAVGQKIEAAPLPEGLLIAKEQETSKTKSKPKAQEDERGEAFHPKKASNVKDYNYSASQKAKMNKKKKH